MLADHSAHNYKFLGVANEMILTHWKSSDGLDPYETYATIKIDYMCFRTESFKIFEENEVCGLLEGKVSYLPLKPVKYVNPPPAKHNYIVIFSYFIARLNHFYWE